MGSKNERDYLKPNEAEEKKPDAPIENKAEDKKPDAHKSKEVLKTHRKLGKFINF